MSNRFIMATLIIVGAVTSCSRHAPLHVHSPDKAREILGAGEYWHPSQEKVQDALRALDVAASKRRRAAGPTTKISIQDFGFSAVGIIESGKKLIELKGNRNGRTRGSFHRTP